MLLHNGPETTQNYHILPFCQTQWIFLSIYLSISHTFSSIIVSGSGVCGSCPVPLGILIQASELPLPFLFNNNMPCNQHVILISIFFLLSLSLITFLFWLQDLNFLSLFCCPIGYSDYQWSVGQRKQYSITACWQVLRMTESQNNRRTYLNWVLFVGYYIYLKIINLPKDTPFTVE